MDVFSLGRLLVSELSILFSSNDTHTLPGSELHLVELIAALSRNLTVANVPTDRVYKQGLKTVLREVIAAQSM